MNDFMKLNCDEFLERLASKNLYQEVEVPLH